MVRRFRVRGTSATMVLVDHHGPWIAATDYDTLAARLVEAEQKAENLWSELKGAVDANDYKDRCLEDLATRLKEAERLFFLARRQGWTDKVCAQVQQWLHGATDTTATQEPGDER